jgi:hypothetical protein
MKQYRCAEDKPPHEKLHAGDAERRHTIFQNQTA